MEQNRRTGRPWRSLRFQILTITIAAWLIPTVTLSVFVLRLFPRLEARAVEALTSGADNAWAATSDRMDALIALARDATYDGELTSAWEKHSAGTLSSADSVRLGRSYLERKYGRESGCVFAAFFPADEPGLMLATQSGSAAAQRFRDTAWPRARETAAAVGTRCAFLDGDDGLFLIRNLMDSRMSAFGMLVLGLDRSALFAPLDEVRAAWQGEASLTIGPPASPPPAAALYDADGFLTLVRLSDSRDWDLSWQLHIPRSLVYGEAVRFRWVLLALYLVLTAGTTGIAVFVFRRIIRPLALLSDASRRIENGEIGLTVPMQGRDELGTLGKAFSAMSLRLKELIDRTYKEEIALRDAQIQALQSRINPHFINNALEDINWQARIDGSEATSRMVSALSVLLNATMANRNRRLVPLREELRVADAYIFFAQERLGDRLRVVREIEDEVLDDALPLLTLQPVLENAIEHGIAPAGGGEIILRCARDGGALAVTVLNSGRAPDGEDRRRMDEALRTGVSGNHVGLGNIAGRLRLIYHGQAEITAGEDGQGRTAVHMRIPRNGKEEPT